MATKTVEIAIPAGVTVVVNGEFSDRTGGTLVVTAEEATAAPLATPPGDPPGDLARARIEELAAKISQALKT